MRLDFNVLWVDDQPQQLTAQFTAISREMEKEGFEFKPTTCATIDEVQAKIGNGLFRDEIDLILVDWQLGGGLHGQDVIAALREEIKYKDVIFYSSLEAVPALKQHAFDAGVEGVFSATKANIVDDVMAVFENLVKKVLDLDHTRGIVMGATSDIDDMVHECLAKIDASGTDAEKKEMLEKAKALVAETMERITDEAKALEGATDTATVLKSYALFQANDRFRVLNAILKAAKYDDHSTLRGGVQRYIQEVVPNRNHLGHLVLIPEGNPAQLLEEGKKVVKLDDMRELRRFLLEVRSDFRKLRDALRGS